MIKAKDEWDTVYGGPESRLDDYSYSSMSFLNSFLKCKIRKDKIKKIFNVEKEEK
jgi:hypothetical protein